MEQVQQNKCCQFKLIFEVILVLATTLTYSSKVVISVYAWWGEYSNIALNVSLQTAFREYALPITPAEWTLALWLVLFTLEGVWILFSWALIFKQHTPRTITPVFYILFSLACVVHTGWVFAWGKLLQELSLALVTAQTLVLIACVGAVSGYLYFIRGTLRFYYRCNFLLTRVLVLNGTIAYATFSLILVLFNLGAVLTDNANLTGETASTIILSLLSSIVVTYFLLENTVLDRFLRYIFSVYPVVLWTLIGILTEVWEGHESLDDRNKLFSLVLACVVSTLIVIRALLWIVFICIRPLPEYERDEFETVPQ